MADDFDTWLVDAAKPQGAAHPWDSWPATATAEVAKVAEYNDANGGVHITRNKIRQRLEEAYGLTVTAHTFNRYVREVLKRAGWKTK